MNTRQKQPTTRANIQDQLIELALEGLKSMYDAKSGLFCSRVVKKDGHLVQESISLRYSLITLLGLERCRRNGISVAFKLDELFRTVWLHSKEIAGIGDYGLLLWLTSNLSPENLAELTDGSVLAKMLEKSKDAKENRTMEVAWFLTGLCHAFCESKEKNMSLKRVASSVHSLLMENYGGNGIFRHKSKKSLAGLLRGRIGSFADQVYPILALTKYGQVFEMRKPIEIALGCAKHICKLQGPLGQWWWHYNSATGYVCGHYPVYSVHQDGMALMALLTVGRAAEVDFTTNIIKGMKWVFGDNELSQCLADSESSFIWRSIHKGTFKNRLDLVYSMLTSRVPETRTQNLQVKYECRPYHLGWILYALHLQEVNQLKREQVPKRERPAA